MTLLAYYTHLLANPLLLVLLIVILIAAIPRWPYNSQPHPYGPRWNYYPLGLILLVLLIVFLLGGCEYTANGPQVKGNAAAHVRNFMKDVEPGVRPAIRLSATLYLDYAVTPTDRADLKANIFTASSIAAAIDDSVAPGELSKRIQAALPAGEENRQLADAIAGSWGIALPFIRGDPALLITWVRDISGGLADVTKS